MNLDRVSVSAEKKMIVMEIFQQKIKQAKKFVFKAKNVPSFDLNSWWASFNCCWLNEK